MGFSQVSMKEIARIKKRLYISHVDEYHGCSKPLNDLVLSTVLDVIPEKSSRKKLKSGYIVDTSREGGFSPCAVILGLLYLKRLSHTNPAFFRTLSSRELFLVAMLLASKYLNDEGEMEALTNTDFATIGSTTRSRLDHLEVKFLEAINWRLFVSLEEYYQFVSSVEGRVALNEACSRGWFSYTDLCAVWEATDLQASMIASSKTTAKVACGGALLYLVCIATLFASTPPPPTSDLCPLISSPSNLSHNNPSVSTVPFNPQVTSETSDQLVTWPSKAPDWDTLDLLTKTPEINRKKDAECPQIGMDRNILDNKITVTNATSVLITENIFHPCLTYAPNDDGGGGHYLETGRLTAAFVAPGLSIPGNTSCVVSSTKEFNPLITVLLNPDDPASNDVFNPDANTFTTANAKDNSLISNTNRKRHNTHISNIMTHSEKINRLRTPNFTEQNGLLMEPQSIDSDFKEHYSPRLKEFQSPVVTIETVPMVIDTNLWDHSALQRIEKNNFTLIEGLGLFAQSVLAW